MKQPLFFLYKNGVFLKLDRVIGIKKQVSIKKKKDAIKKQMGCYPKKQCSHLKINKKKKRNGIREKLFKKTMRLSKKKKKKGFVFPTKRNEMLLLMKCFFLFVCFKKNDNFS